jgi:hypothetical protein
MQIHATSSVSRIADWQYSGVSYYVHVGQVAHMAGYLSLLAVGPASTCRSVVLGPSTATLALRYILSAPDLASRSGTAECLLTLGDEQH